MTDDISGRTLTKKIQKTPFSLLLFQQQWIVCQRGSAHTLRQSILNAPVFEIHKKLDITMTLRYGP